MTSAENSVWEPPNPVKEDTPRNSQAPLQGSGDGHGNKKPSYRPDSTSRFVEG